jgi:ribosomal protein S12 methylthiotransferase
MLKQMRRPERKASIREKVSLARSLIPDVAIRTTCIVGFPGETDDQFRELLDFLDEMRFDGVACFTYSAQEGTRAWEMGDDVPDEVKRERQEAVSELQRVLTGEKLESLAGTRSLAIVDGEEGGVTHGRSWWQAQDIDGLTYLDRNPGAGSIVEVEFTGSENDYDLRASVVSVLDAPPTRNRVRERRSLPLVAATTGAYGR